KPILQHVRTENRDVTTRCAFTLGPDASRIDAHSVDIKHRDRLDAAYPHILRFLIVVLDRLDRISGDSHTPTRRTQALNRFCIFVRHVFTTIELYEVFARLDDLRVLRDREDGGTL